MMISEVGGWILLTMIGEGKLPVWSGRPLITNAGQVIVIMLSYRHHHHWYYYHHHHGHDLISYHITRTGITNVGQVIVIIILTYQHQHHCNLREDRQHAFLLWSFQNSFNSEINQNGNCWKIRLLWQHSAWTSAKHWQAKARCSSSPSTLSRLSPSPWIPGVKTLWSPWPRRGPARPPLEGMQSARKKSEPALEQGRVPAAKEPTSQSSTFQCDQYVKKFSNRSPDKSARDVCKIEK